MRIALMADIHANREAFEACLAHAGGQRIDRFAFLGDYVNYGADPEWVVETLRGHVERGAIAVLGNHDAAVGEWRESMTSPAEVALGWTRVQLGAEDRKFLSGLPLVHEEDGLLLVHADASAPAKWAYVADAEDAGRCLRATTARLILCGHVHKPALYSLSAVWKTTGFQPVTGAPVPLFPHRRYLMVVGSVGQPRDGNPAAAYSVLDLGKGELTTFRVPYDIDAAAAKIRAARLPEMLAERLHQGL